MISLFDRFWLWWNNLHPPSRITPWPHKATAFYFSWPYAQPRHMCIIYLVYVREQIILYFGEQIICICRVKLRSIFKIWVKLNLFVFSHKHALELSIPIPSTESRWMVSHLVMFRTLNFYGWESNFACLRLKAVSFWHGKRKEKQQATTAYLNPFFCEIVKKLSKNIFT